MEGEMIITTTTEYVLGNNNETSTVARGEERRGRRRGSKERKDRESAYLEADLTQEIAALRAGLEARLGVDSEAIGRIREKGWLKLLRRTGGDVEIAVRLLQDKEARFEARRQKKLARREARGGEGEDKKLLDKEERLRLKTERKEARLKACEERKERRLEKEKERKEKKEKKVDGARDAGFVDLIEEGGLPHGIKGLYLDGNNMLFISQALRKYVLSRGQRWVAEAALSTIAEEYARLPVVKGGARLETAVMIYDSVPKRTCGVKQLPEGTSFTITSARPDFSTSDDALVAWATAMGPEKASACIFVTSDRELKNRLIATGAFVAKPKQWVELAKNTLLEAQMQQHQHQASSAMDESEEHEEEEAAAQPTAAIPAAESLDVFLDKWIEACVLTNN